MPVSNPGTPTMRAEVDFVRTLDAPRDRVFQMWTDAKHLARWWGPHGMTNPVCEFDTRAGGKILIHMAMPDGTIYPMTGVVDEIDPPNRLVFTAFAEDMAGTRYLKSITTVTFEDAGEKTKLTVHAVGTGLVPAAAQMLGGMQMGWEQSLEKLEAAL